MIEKIVGRVMAEIAAKQETKKADPIDAAIDTLTGKKEDAGNDGEAKVCLLYTSVGCVVYPGAEEPWLDRESGGE